MQFKINNANTSPKHSVRYAPEFDKNYIKLEHRAEKGESEATYLMKLIHKATDKLSENKEAGVKIPRKQWPKEYIKKHDITNLWKYNLDSYWRLAYTLTGSEVSLFLIYLEYLDHKKYDRKFKYRTS